jgi:hypothetical protein
MKITILKAVSVGLMLLVLGGLGSVFATDANSAPAEKTFDAPHGLKVSVKMIGPYSEPADLQIICLFKHKATGDTYQNAAKDTDEHLHGILSALRNRGEFAGELGETFLFTPPNGSIPAKRFMVIGLGEEKDLSLDSLRVVGRIAAREAVRLEAKHVAWAPNGLLNSVENCAVYPCRIVRSFQEEGRDCRNKDGFANALAAISAYVLGDLATAHGNAN